MKLKNSVICSDSRCDRLTKNRSMYCWQHEGKQKGTGTPDLKNRSAPKRPTLNSTETAPSQLSPWNNQHVLFGSGVQSDVIGVYRTSHGEVAIAKVRPGQDQWNTDRQPYVEIHVDKLSAVNGSLSGDLGEEAQSRYSNLYSKIMDQEASDEEIDEYSSLSKRLSNATRAEHELHDSMLNEGVLVFMRDGRTAEVVSYPSQNDPDTVTLKTLDDNPETTQVSPIEAYIDYES